MDGNGHNAQAPATAITLALSFDLATRQVSLNGSTQDEMILLYMLEKAKDAVKAFVAEQAKGQRIVPATTLPFISH
jgi:hypothetical protein